MQSAIRERAAINLHFLRQVEELEKERQMLVRACCDAACTQLIDLYADMHDRPSAQESSISSRMTHYTDPFRVVYNPPSSDCVISYAEIESSCPPWATVQSPGVEETTIVTSGVCSEPGGWPGASKVQQYPPFMVKSHSLLVTEIDEGLVTHPTNPLEVASEPPADTQESHFSSWNTLRATRYVANDHVQCLSKPLSRGSSNIPKNAALCDEFGLRLEPDHLRSSLSPNVTACVLVLLSIPCFFWV